jgi:rod shape determining protein RodA
MSAEGRCLVAGPRTASQGGSLLARLAERIDWVLVGAVGALGALGLVAIHSATDPSSGHVARQALALGVGAAGAAGIAGVKPRSLRAWWPLAYAGLMVVLGWVLVGGVTVNTATSWLRLGPLQLQPSELAKPVLIVALAAVCSARRSGSAAAGWPRGGDGDARTRSPAATAGAAVALAGGPVVPIVAQPDVGTAAVLVAAALGVVVVAGVRLRHLAGLTVVGAVVLVAAVQLGWVAEYQLDRLQAFAAPAAAAEGQTYSATQAEIAVGSGGVLGKGLGQGSQTRLAFVPEDHTDFVFAVVAEELGFVGAAAALAAFGLVAWRGLRFAATADDPFGRLVAAGVVSALAFQVFVGVGMAVGLAPVTGLPVPLVSYGGTSAVAWLLMVGILQGVRAHHCR